MPAKLYGIEEIPRTISWIQELNASEAALQCKLWQLEPKPTLEENRVLLKDFARIVNETRQEDKQQQPAEVADSDRQTNSTAQPSPVDLGTPDWLQAVQATAEAVGKAVAQSMASAAKSQASGTAANAVTRDLVDSLPVTSGEDPKSLISFLISAKKIAQLNLTDTQGLVLRLLPKTSNHLRLLWASALAQPTTLPALISQVMGTLITQRQHHILISDMIYRTQGPSEPLVEYVTNIRDTAALLAPSQGAADLLEAIMAGLNPVTRASLAGLPPPRSVDELLALAPRLRAIQNQPEAPTPHQQYSQRPPAHCSSPTNYPPPRGQQHNPAPRYGPYRPNYPQNSYNYRNYPTRQQLSPDYSQTPPRQYRPSAGQSYNGPSSRQYRSGNYQAQSAPPRRTQENSKGGRH